MCLSRDSVVFLGSYLKEKMLFSQVFPRREQEVPTLTTARLDSYFLCLDSSLLSAHSHVGTQDRDQLIHP